MGGLSDTAFSLTESATHRTGEHDFVLPFALIFFQDKPRGHLAHSHCLQPGNTGICGDRLRTRCYSAHQGMTSIGFSVSPRASARVEKPG